MSTELDLLQQAFLTESTEPTIVKAEDLQHDGIDWSKTFFEPQPNKSYTLKFVKNIESSENLVHRKLYKVLPDPKRKGKTFQYVSPGNNTCPVLNLFFELNAASKEGNALAKMKIDEFLGQTNQACAVVQILASDDSSEVGQYRLFSFSNFGQNAHVANLLNQKLNPSESQLKNGYQKEDMFNIFESSALILEVTESVFDGKKGRDFSKSSWTPVKRGAYVKLDDGKIHEFSKNDIGDNGALKPEVLPAFQKLVEILKTPEISMHNYFAYKALGDPKNTEATEEYLKLVNEKVEEIVPIIREATSLDAVKNYGKAEAGTSATPTNDSAQTIGGVSANIILDSTPTTELDASNMNEQTSTQTMTTPNVAGGDAVNDILMGN